MKKVYVLLREDGGINHDDYTCFPIRVYKDQDLARRVANWLNLKTLKCGAKSKFHAHSYYSTLAVIQGGGSIS